MATRLAVEQGLLHQHYPSLYGHTYDESEMDRRFGKLVETHQNLFGQASPSVFSTAGRTELGGNHTDHNLGRVLAATINLDTIAAVTKRTDNKVVLISEGYPAVEIDLDVLEVVEQEKNTTEALVRGIACAFSKRGLVIGGWQANTTSRVLKGSGLSSSAAVEVLCGTIFNHLYNADALSPVELAIIGKFSENVYFGKPSGLMDQMACAYGGIIGIDFADEQKPVIEPIQYSFSEQGYHLCIVDTGGNHADLTPAYAAVPAEMRKVAAYFSKDHLRQVDQNTFFQALPELRSRLNNDRCLLRAMHFFQENIRVKGMLACLAANDIKAYLSLVRQSGESSFCFLQNLYPSFFPEEQGLSLAIAMTKSMLGPDATVRVHGGGFAGTIQAYVQENELKNYIQGMEAVFGKGSVTPSAVRSKPTCCIAE
ncbi:MAG: galactokinase [Spirochaetales bacterium]|nr:galactokinase [Spirochaetales bacterium]